MQAGDGPAEVREYRIGDGRPVQYRAVRHAAVQLRNQAAHAADHLPQRTHP